MFLSNFYLRDGMQTYVDSPRGKAKGKEREEK